MDTSIESRQGQNGEDKLEGDEVGERHWHEVRQGSPIQEVPRLCEDHTLIHWDYPYQLPLHKVLYQYI